MRMWMVDTRTLCRKHLLGEHVEIHMFIGTLKRKVNISGYIQNNLLEPSSLFNRHEELKQEMIKRGYNHKSDITEEDLKEAIKNIPEEFMKFKVNKHLSEEDLYKRCKECCKLSEGIVHEKV